MSWIYIAKRLLYTIPILFGVMLVTFFLFHWIGLDPCEQRLGKHKDATMLQECRDELGLSEPVYKQFVTSLTKIAQFDFGRSYATRQKVSDILKEGAGPSLSITVPAFLIGTLLALAIGLLVAFFRGRWPDRAAVFLCIFGMSITVLAYIVMGQYFLAFKLGWFPVSGYGEGADIVAYVALPVMIWVIVGLGYDVRFFRTCFLDEMNQDYTRTARAKGLSQPKVLTKHVLKNAMIPVVTHIVIQVPFLITGSLLIENFFQIPGLGNALITAIHNADYPVLETLVFLGALGFTIFHLITDICYALLDPRVRLQELGRG